MRWLRYAAWALIFGTVAIGGFLVVAYVRSDNACEAGGPPPAHPIRAALRCEYGGPAAVQVVDIEKPVPGVHEVLVRVRSAAVNPLDWHTVRGSPYFMRLGSGLRKPKVTRIGVDFAGVVEAVGAGVTRFKPGDEVFGGRNGAFAEYVIVPDDKPLAIKPPGLTDDQAAALPIAATTALQALRDRGHVRAGGRVLINGASGGVGTFAVQIAKSLGAEVTGVCSARNADMVRALGADHVIDYRTSDYTAGEARYDVIVDMVGNRPLSENRRVLVERGRYVQVGGGGPDDGRWLGPLPRVLAAVVLSKFVSQDLGMTLAQLRQADLETLAAMVQAGKLRPVIDRTYPLAGISEALAYLEEGHARGKVVIRNP